MQPIPPEQSLIQYPSAFPIKVMGLKVDGFAHAIVDVARRFDPGFDPATINPDVLAEIHDTQAPCTIGPPTTMQIQLLPYTAITPSLAPPGWLAVAMTTPSMNYTSPHTLRTSYGYDPTVIYDDLPYFFSDQYDLGMEYVGYATEWDEVVVRGSRGCREATRCGGWGRREPGGSGRRRLRRFCSRWQRKR